MDANAVDANDVASRILYEDNHLIVVSKLCGEISQGDKTGDSTFGDLIKSYIKQRDAKPGNVFLTPVHRLDRPVSGATVFAKTTKATSRMNKLFRDGEVAKQYWAVTSSRPDSDEGDLVHYLTRNPKNNKSFARAEASDGAKRAELHFRIAGKSDRYFLLEIVMKTGRHHQIRAQLAAIGCPIRGDLKYGFPRSNKGGGISLHARELSFVHPVSGKPVHVCAEPPADDALWAVFGKQMRDVHNEK